MLPSISKASKLSFPPSTPRGGSSALGLEEMVIQHSLAWVSWGSWHGVSVLVAIPQLETRCRSLRSTQQATSTENRQLEESNRVLEDRLQHLHRQLQQTHGRLRTARAAAAQEHAEKPG